MAIDPTTTTTVKVSELASAGFNTTDLVPHEVGGYLKKGTLQDLATFIGAIISTDDSVGFRAVTVTDGQTLPATTEQEFILVGPGTYPNVGGGSAITTTEPLNALVSNGTYWFIGVEIPISATGTWGSIDGNLESQTDLQDALDLKADLVEGKVPASQLPSYVDDVVEVANYAALPATGEVGKIYITLDTNKVYRWSGSAYIEIAANNAVWGSITGTLSSQTDLNSALGLKVPYTGATGNVDLGSHTLSSHDLVVNHTSGSGAAATISKGGSGEALTVTKSSGSGNVASFAGGVTSISELHLTTDLADAYIASAATWNAKQAALSGTGFVKASGSTISYDNSTYVPTSRTITINGFGYDLTSNIDFTIPQGVWGQITGTLSAQTDLQQTLNTKEGTISGGTTSQYWRGDKSWQNLNKTAVGLANVDNTTDLAKPVSTATQTALDAKVPTSRTITINGFGYDLTSDVNFTVPSGVWGGITGALSNQTDLYQTLNTKMPADRAITINGVTQSLTQDRTWTVGTAWGGITGTLSSQTDLQTALDTKVPTSRTITINGTGYDLSANVNFTIGAGVWGQITGTLSNQTDLYQTLNTKMPADRAITINGVTQSLTQDRSWTISTIGGTGTNGYVAFWNGTSNQAGDSNLFWDNTNKRLGIGTTSPVRKLTISNGGAEGIEIGVGSTNDIISYNRSTGAYKQLVFEAASYNFGVGNVGIGTTSPEGKLTVQGTSAQPPISGTTANSLLQLKGSLGNELNIGCNTAAGDYGSYIQSSDNNLAVPYSLNLQPNGGNVGIGTTSPASNLHVKGSGAYAGIIVDNTGTTGGGYFSAYQNGSQVGILGSSGSIVGDTSSDLGLYSEGGKAIRFYTGGSSSERMRIASSGNVGIGTTSPTSAISGSAKVLSIVDNSTSNVGSFRAYGGGTSTSIELFGGGSQVGLYGSTAHPMVFSTDSTERMRITSGGNVGIGTTSPSVKLHVAAASGDAVTLMENPAGNFAQLRLLSGSGNPWVFGTQSDYLSGALVIRNGSDRVVISTGGTVTASAGFFNSDMRLKDLTEYDYNISDIKPISYFWKDGRDDKKHVGYSAQEVQKVMPDAVNEGTDGMLSVNYVEVLVAQVELLNNRMAEMQKEIELLKSK